MSRFRSSCRRRSRRSLCSSWRSGPWKPRWSRCCRSSRNWCCRTPSRCSWNPCLCCHRRLQTSWLGCLPRLYYIRYYRCRWRSDYRSKPSWSRQTRMNHFRTTRLCLSCYMILNQNRSPSHLTHRIRCRKFRCCPSCYMHPSRKSPSHSNRSPSRMTQRRSRYMNHFRRCLRWSWTRSCRVTRTSRFRSRRCHCHHCCFRHCRPSYMKSRRSRILPNSSLSRSHRIPNPSCFRRFRNFPSCRMPIQILRSFHYWNRWSSSCSLRR